MPWTMRRRSKAVRERRGPGLRLRTYGLAWRPCLGDRQQHAFIHLPAGRRFFYKYTPLPNLIIENNPRQKILSFLAWRERLKATRGSFRHWHWRKEKPATGTGGHRGPAIVAGGKWRSTAESGADVIPPLQLAGSGGSAIAAGGKELGGILNFHRSILAAVDPSY
jgi:hypothetical protein